MMLLKSSISLPRSPSILLFLFLTLPALAGQAGTARAGSWYVAPSAEIPIRSGQGSQYKILAVVPSGLRVEVIQEEAPWVQVRTPGGTEGWMLRRYLSNEPPLTEVVARLKEQLEQLSREKTEIGQKYNELLSAYSGNEQLLNTCIAERDATRLELKTLRADTADVIKTKDKLAQVTRQLKESEKEVALLRQRTRDLQRNASIRWFLAGSGVLFFGILLGMINTRSRKRKSSLY